MPVAAADMLGLGGDQGHTRKAQGTTGRSEAAGGGAACEQDVQLAVELDAQVGVESAEDALGRLLLLLVVQDGAAGAGHVYTHDTYIHMTLGETHVGPGKRAVATVLPRAASPQTPRSASWLLRGRSAGDGMGREDITRVINAPVSSRAVRAHSSEERINSESCMAAPGRERRRERKRPIYRLFC